MKANVEFELSCRRMMNQSTRVSVIVKGLVGYCLMRWEW